MQNTYIRLLTEQRQQAWNQAKAILDGADAQKRELTAEEDAAFMRVSADLDALDARLKVENDRQQRDRASMETFEQLRGRPAEGRVASAENALLADEFRNRIRTRSREPIEISFADARSGHQPGIERRDMTTTGMTGTTFYRQLLAHMVDGSAILAAGATLITTDTGEALKVPKSTAQSTAAITAEASPIGQSDPTLGSVQLDAYKYAFLVKVSNELANDAAFDLVGYLAQQAGEAIANGAGAHFMAGDGSGKPNGLVGASTAGVTGGTGVTGAFTADNLIDLQHSLAEPYARSAAAAWIMKNSTLGAVRKLKDQQDRYLFDVTPPVGTGAAGTLLGRPVFVDPNVPAVAVSAKSVLFGDISRYWVRQVRALRFERSDDFAFDEDVITFRVLWRADGDLIDTTGAVKHFAGGAS